MPGSDVLFSSPLGCLQAFAGGVDPFALVRDDVDSLEFSLLSAGKK